MQTGKEEKKLDGHSHWVQSAAFSQGGRRAVFGSNDKTVRIWSVKTQKEDILGHKQDSVDQGHDLCKNPIIVSTPWIHPSEPGSRCWFPYSNISACASNLSSVCLALQDGGLIILKNSLV